MLIDILSLFPEYFDSPFNASMIKRAREKGLVNIRSHNIRDFAKDKHQSVDDRPYGGGPGMVLMPEPLESAINNVRKENSHVIYLSPQGSQLNSQMCHTLAKYDHLILLCGHYEGIDQRIIDTCVDREVSIGDYVLTSGCPAAVVFVDAVIRFVPEVIGHPDAVYQDSFEEGIFDSPHYTRPQVYKGHEVPSVLMEGHHEKIKNWRKQKGLEKTRLVRPDLYEKYQDQLDNNN
ncbi:MAG: tRNA (guanosine(37)-N1)-methyltransferase TrmD [Chlamydiota bacterium]|jgi:tRNA (guanine37-N1)-methyltransferase